MVGAVEELRAKRRELQERREALLAEARTFEADTASIDRCIVLLDPAAAPSDPPPLKRTKWPSIPSVDREFSTLVAGALRTAAGPVDTSALAEAVLRAKGVGADDSRPANLSSRVAATLNHMLKRGRVRRIAAANGADRPLWEVVR